jgi:hypothetical protein
MTVSPRLLLAMCQVNYIPKGGGQEDIQVVGNIAEAEGDRDLEEQADRRHGVARQGTEAEAVDDGGRVGVEGALGAVVGQGNQDVGPQAPVGKGALEGAQVDVLLLLALHGVILQHARLQDVQLSLGEEGVAREEAWAGVAERVGQAKAEDEAAEDGEAAHDDEEPEPTCSVGDATHV